MTDQPTPSRRTGLRANIAAAIWERQNPGRKWADCEHPWQADAEADADAVLGLLHREWPWLRAEAEDTKTATDPEVRRQLAATIKSLGHSETELAQLRNRLRLAHQARRAKEHQLDGIRHALCDIGFMQDDDPYAHADLADVIRQNGEALHTEPVPAAPEATQLEATARVFAGLHQSAEQDVTRVIALYEQWVKAGPPPLGASINRWWDTRLAELHTAINPTKEN